MVWKVIKMIFKCIHYMFWLFMLGLLFIAFFPISVIVYPLAMLLAEAFPFPKVDDRYLD